MNLSGTLGSEATRDTMSFELELEFPVDGFELELSTTSRRLLYVVLGLHGFVPPLSHASCTR